MHALSIVLLSIALGGCTIINEELIILDGLVTVVVIDDKPKVRVSTGIKECKWRGRASLKVDDYEVWVKCSIPFTL